LGPSRSHTPSIEVIEEEKADDPQERRSSDTNRIPSDASQTSVERGGTTGSPDNITSDDTNTNETSSSGFSRSATQPPTATYFPPAYRPASVRSLQVHTSGPSRPSAPTLRSQPVVEKMTAPGYYPAPATEDSEVALAVASRSDGKQRMDVPPPDDEEEEQRVRHIATDDKLLLERMRLGGSAPPQHGVVDDNGSVPTAEVDAGPSAPTVEVDDQGFELHDHENDHDPTELAPEIGESSSSELPAPPRQRPVHRVYSQADLAETMELDELHLLPSAPPPAHEDHLVPSAPPFISEEEDEPAPTAPTFDLIEDEEQQSENTAEAVSETESPELPVPVITPRVNSEEAENDHHRKPSLPTYVP
jgi:hypothetical protein